MRIINKKIIFMGTPVIASEYLNALINKDFNIQAVYTQPPKKQSRGLKVLKSPVHQLAENKKIDVFSPNKFDDDNIKKLKDINPDLIIVVAYGKIIPKQILELPKFGCINVHLSILPRWRGASPVEHALMSGDEETGISIIKLIEELDAGPIINQEKVHVPNDINKLQLINHLNIIGTKLLIQTIPLIFENKIKFKYQNENTITYAKKISTESRKINFENTSKKIINHIRAFAPKPGAWFLLNQERIKILDAKLGTSKGSISRILNDKFEIGCADGCIEPLILQREGKNIMSKDDFLKGYKINLNDKINAQL